MEAEWEEEYKTPQNKLGRVFKSTTVRETHKREKGVGGKTLHREETDVGTVKERRDSQRAREEKSPNAGNVLQLSDKKALIEWEERGMWR